MTATLVAPGDTDGWTAAMVRLVREPEHGLSLARAAREEQVRAFSLDTMGRSYERIYAETRMRDGAHV